MTANDRPWDVKLYIYPGGNPALPATGWGLDEDISSYIKYPGSEGGSAITYSGGKRSESSNAADAGEMSLSVDTKDGRLCTDNAMSDLWPLLDLNCPTRMGVTSGFDSFTRTTSGGLGTSTSGQAWTAAASFATNGSAATVSLAAANSLTRCSMAGAGSADWDVTVTMSVPNVATGNALFQAIYQELDSTPTYLAFGIDWGLAGVVGARIKLGTVSGISDIAIVNPMPLTYSAGELFKCRAMRDGATVAVKIWKAATAEPAAWTTSATNTSVPCTNLGLYALRTSGNTNTGPQFTFDDLTITGIEFTGTVVQWPVEWDQTGRNSWATIKAAGILRRLRQAKTGALQSPLRHQLPFYGPTDYWPMEDGPRAATFANIVNPAYPAKYSGVTPAADSSLPGADVAPQSSNTLGTIIGFAKKKQGGTGFAVMFLTKIQTNPPSSLLFARFTTRAGLVRTFSLSLNGTGPGYTVDGDQADGTSVFSSGSTASSLTSWDGQWIAFCLKVEQSGANVTWTMLRYALGDPVGFFSSGSYASTVIPVLDRVDLAGAGANWNGTSFAHLWVGPNTLPFISFSFFNAATGFDGELASDRAQRIGDQAGIPIAVEAGTSEALGPQPKGKAIDVLQAAADADYALLYERAAGLGFRPRSARWNQAVALTLSVASKHIAAPPTPVRDDQRIRNKVTVVRDGGSSVTVQDDASIAKVGEYEEQVTIGVKTDDVLSGHAEFRRFVGTRGGMRWPGVSLDFSRTPSLVPSWRTRLVSPRLTIATGRSQVAGNEPDLLAEGFVAALHPRGWTVTLSCTDARVFDLGVWDDPVAGRSRYGPSTATLNSGITTTATSIAVLAGGETWRTGAISPALQILIDGEQISVSSISGPVSDVYTLTVSARSVNGVVKTHSAGAAVTLADQKRYGF